MRIPLPFPRRADHRPVRPVVGLVFCGILLVQIGAAAAADTNDLVAFLDRAEKMTTLNDKVKAEITVREADGTSRALALALDPAAGGTATLTDPATGWKSVTPLAWKEGTVVEKTGATEHKIGVNDPLAGSDLRGIDFFPFWKTDYSGSFISDENTLEKTVSIYAAKGRPYTLYVVSFDKAKLIPRMVKFYKDSFSNLVRIRTDKDFVMVGSRPRPTQILVRDFAGSTLRTYDLKWSLADAPAPGAQASAPEPAAAGEAK